jgi:2-dehydro-3-deoxygalactonokinase
MSQPVLIALDWGTSNLRATLLGANGDTLEARSAPGGVMAVPDRDFAGALLSLCGDWLEAHALPVIASGMVGSRQGWQEAPYLDCPADLASAARQCIQVELKTATGASRRVHIAAGLRCLHEDGAYDVMRGEETQIWGAGIPDSRCCVLPGTHSKWAWTGAKGQVARFRTYLTGELYGLLTQHGILGRLMVHGQAQPAAFEAGVRRGLAGHHQATHLLFAARTAGLMGQVEPEGLPDYLSGMLLGIEIAAATEAGGQAAVAGGVTLIGDDGLCSRYETALGLAGIASTRAPAEATTQGQWLLARAAELVGAA